MTDKNLMIMDHNTEPAVQGRTIIFKCSHGMEFMNATCTDKGEWEPQLSCTSK